MGLEQDPNRIITVNDRCYRITFEPLIENEMTTNTPKFCLCCGNMISTIGGGGEFVCDTCHELMRNRKFWVFARKGNYNV